MDTTSIGSADGSLNTTVRRVEAAWQSGSSRSEDALDYSSFLTLLIAQIQNQDPMEPMKSSDYVAQLATFSQVEKTIELNDRMASVLDAVRSQQAISMIGVAITSADSNKSGVIVASRVDGDGVVVTLESGEEVRIGRGVEVGRSNA